MANRYSSPTAEAKYPWLKTILDTFYISDSQVEDHLAKVAKKGVTPACHRGCDACCKKATVPFTAPELKAISWYASEALSGDVRSVVKQRLLNHADSLECPFLVESVCSIYPVRPLICRQFLVMGSPCTTEEDVGTDRPQDIIPLPRETVIRPVAMRLLDDFEFKTTAAKRKAFESGFISHNARDMHEFDWTIISKTMQHFDDEA
ncbi:YkgJ family cysteine cluster protein [Ideonella sp. DXS22W]|uniref:YkgJ family cysteine cluster protein n=1 Tax=Pseudaquabacterium inlustre TaxID=2984192 RepID=A0ABU9CCJ8_9BURK